MENQCQETPPVLQELEITIQKSSLVFPDKETERKSIFLSNIDQVVNFNVETVHFFASNEDFPPQTVAEKVKNAFEKILVPYDFLAGRMKFNTNTGRLEIDCNGAGAGFVVASSESTLDEIGDLVYPNPAFANLVNSLQSLEKDGKPLCVIQVTSFKCGGFAIGISTSHATFDGISFKTFLDNLAAVAGGKPLAVPPCNDRELLAARSPPRVTFPHPELLKLQTHLGQELNPPVFDAAQEALDFKIFRLTSGNISDLKEKAKTSPSARISGFNVVTAHIWRCKALSHDLEVQDPDRVSTILYAVNIRPRLIPPLPVSYAGNAVLTAYASARCRELREGPISKLVEMVAEGAKRITDEYARSAIDWGEIYKGFPHGEFLISSWWKLGFDEVEYPWGCPRYSCPVVYHRKDIILLFPDVIDDKNSGVNVLVALPKKQMEKFETLFHEYLSV
uniref:Omega-hydroxypalmitate O-feruloyl transferase n=1 Tax=Salix viminalis TaxID=40686 RepID=A0A6N2LQY8_SALVM